MTYAGKPVLDMGTAIAQAPVNEAAIFGCRQGASHENYAHDFSAYDGPRGGHSLLYCRRCGQIRKLELATPMDEWDPRVPST